MNTFLKTNKNLITYSLILMLIVPIFGVNFFISFIGNIMILLFLIPLLILLILFITFSSLKSKVNTCSQCGFISIGSNNKCANCGFELRYSDIEKDLENNIPSERTIEVKAEEVE